MPINPCGRIVDYLRESVTDLIRPFKDSNLTVRRRWYRVSESAPPLGFPTALYSARWEPFPERPRAVGEVYPPVIEYRRPGILEGFSYAHLCGTAEEFASGVAFDPSRHIVYDSEWIPECCGREDVCTFNKCDQQPVNGLPASQFFTYPIHHVDADDDTQFFVRQVAENQGNGAPARKGFFIAYYPAGKNGAAAHEAEFLVDGSGVPESFRQGFIVSPTNRMDATATASGFKWEHQSGGASGYFTAGMVGGVLEIGGSNAKLHKSLLPDGVTVREAAGVLAAGTTQATAAAITTSTTQVVALSTAAGVRMPATTATGGRIFFVTHSNGSPVASLNLYPASGEAFAALGLNNPIVLAKNTSVVLVENGGGTGNWGVINY